MAKVAAHLPRAVVLLAVAGVALASVVVAEPKDTTAKTPAATAGKPSAKPQPAAANAQRDAPPAQQPASNMPAATAPSADARAAVSLNADEREHLRAGMRRYLQSIQGIVQAVTENKVASAAGSAKAGGMAMLADVPLSIGFKVPPEFISLSMDTHRRFDDLARTAENPGTKAAVLSALNDILNNCTSCHAMYRLAPQ